MIVNSNVGLVDVVFLKGNVIGGANGATDAAKAEAFARAFVKALPGRTPQVDSEPTRNPRAKARGRRGLRPTTSRSTHLPSARSDIRMHGRSPTPPYPPRSPDERETDADPAEEPRAARRGEPGRRAVLASPVRHPGRRLRRRGRRRASAAGCCSATAGGWRASSRRPRSSSRTTRSRSHPSRPNIVVVRSTPARRPRTSPPRTRRPRPARTRRSRWSRRPWTRWAASGASGTSSPRATSSSSSRTSPSTRTPTSPRPPSPTRSRPSSSSASAAGARKVIVADNPINNPESCFFKTKVGDAAAQAPGPS